MQGSLILNPTLKGRPNSEASQMMCLESQHTEHWPPAGSCLQCHVYTAKNKQIPKSNAPSSKSSYA